MSGFTKGPWIVDPIYLSEVQTDGLKSIASCWHEHAEGQSIVVTGVLECSLEESAANARLIAAAPELLEAAEAYIKAYDDVTGTIHVVDMMRSAIAKARGGQG